MDTRARSAGTEPAREGGLARIALWFTQWAETWFPDAYVFAAVALVVVAGAALANGASPVAVTRAFGDGFWSLILFTMQMVFVVIAGYVVASSPPAARLINWLAGIPATGRSAVAFVAAISMLVLPVVDSAGYREASTRPGVVVGEGGTPAK